MQLLLLVGLAAAAQVRAQSRLRVPLQAPNPQSFLLLSSPARGVVEYMRLPDGPVHPLIDHGLTRPQGLAVLGDTLYVADRGAKRIEAYELSVITDQHQKEHLKVGKYRTLVSDVEAYSIAAGNLEGEKLYFTDSENKFVKQYDLEKQVVSTLFDGEDVPEVAAPGGIAMAGLQGLLWTNKVRGSTAGSLVEADLPTKTITKKTENVDETYGVCVSNSNIFYTSEVGVYGVKRVGGGPVEVSTAISQPRGCAYDMDGTVYFADEAGGKVYSMPANAETLAAADLTEVASMAEPYGIFYLSYDPTKHVKPGLVEKFVHWWETDGPLA